MNRAELRRQQRLEGKKNKTYTLTQEQIDVMKEEMFRESLSVSFAMMMIISSTKLLECWEKSAKIRIPKFLDGCIELYKKVGARKITLKDLVKNLEEKCDIKIKYTDGVDGLRRRLKNERY